MIISCVTSSDIDYGSTRNSSVGLGLEIPKTASRNRYSDCRLESRRGHSCAFTTDGSYKNVASNLVVRLVVLLT